MPDRIRGKQLHIYVSQEELEFLQSRAKAAKLALATWARQVLLLGNPQAKEKQNEPDR